MNCCSSILRTLFIYYTVFCVSLGSLPFEWFLIHLREGNIVDVLYHAQKNNNVIDVAREFIEPKVPSAHANGATDAMMTYDTINNGTSTPKYRLWSGSAWGAEQSASAFAGTELYNMQVRYAPTRDEAILVAITNSGQIQAQVFNGTTWWSPTTLSTVGDTINNPNGASLFRWFDIEYEQTSGDAIVIVADNTADPDYYVWNGTSWTGPTNIDIPTTGRPLQIELASRPGSDELAFITLDTNSDVYGMRWTGTAWNNMAVATAWETTASIAGTRKAIDVAFETTSWDIMFAWWFATVATAHFRYRAYAAGVLGAVTNVTNANQGGVVSWLKLAPNPTTGSDQIMIGLHDAGSDLNTFIWSGTAWSAVHAEHSAGLENAAVEMDFDITFETHSSNPNDAWLVWSDGATVSRKLWDGGTSAWAAATTMGDDNAAVVLSAHPNNGAVLAAVYEDDTSATKDIREARLTGGSQTWSAIAQIWDGGVRRNIGVTRIALATQKFSSSTEGMLVYVTEDSTTNPQYRRWTGSSWGSPASASGTNGELRHMVLKTSPKRDEAVLVTLGNNGRVEAQIWNGTTNSWGSATTLCTTADVNGNRDVQSLYRWFDVEYEQSSGDAIVVCSDGTADPNYYVWNGTTWSWAVDINIPNTGITNYIELASRSGTDELAMIVLDANVDVYGMRWTGSAWDAMGAAAVWDATASLQTKKTIDVAFEKTSGDIMFAWWFATVATAHFRYRAYSGAVLWAVTNVVNANQGWVVHWLELASNPTNASDQIMIWLVDAGSDLNTFIWSGTAWSAVHTEHSAGIESITAQAFDVAFETHSSNPNDAWLTWGDGATVSRKLWDGGTSTWAAATTQGDDTDYVQLNAQPNSGAFFMNAYESSASVSMDITENRMTGGVQTWWTASAVFSGPVMRTGLSFAKVAVAAENYISPTYTQQAYRFFNNTNSADVGTVLAAQDTPATLGSAGAAFRLRALLRVDTNSILPNAQNFKLQFAQKSGTCDTAFSGETYADVTAATVIAYNDNATPADGAALTANANDPTDGGRTIVNQDYEELNNFTNTEAAIASGQDGKWDFSLKDNGALSNTDYCFRMVKSDGSTLNTYTVIPQITTAAGWSVSVDIVDSGGTPVGSPSVTMNSVIVTIGHQSATWVFSDASQKIRVTNNSGNAQWSLTIAANGGATAFWDWPTTDYDFNDPTANAGDGADTDSLGGRMSLNPSVGTLGGTCTATGITKWSSSSFSEGATNSITILTAGATANTGCYWDFTGIDISQTIPGEKPTGSYSLSMTLTATAI
jgi:hypothetical protein